MDAALLGSLALPCLLLAFAVSYGVLLLLPGRPSDALRAIAPQFGAYALWFGALWMMLKHRYDLAFWPSMAWRVPWPYMGLTLIIGPLLVILVAVLGEALRTPPVDNAIQRLLRDRFSVLLVGFVATTLGPLAEELIFRGFLQPLAMRTFGSWAGIAVASMPFALLHGPQYSWNWQHVLLLFLASFVFGLVRWRTDSTAASTLTHAAYNLTTFTAFLLQRKDLFT
jgi:hypothetical protein